MTFRGTVAKSGGAGESIYASAGDSIFNTSVANFRVSENLLRGSHESGKLVLVDDHNGIRMTTVLLG